MGENTASSSGHSSKYTLNMPRSDIRDDVRVVYQNGVSPHYRDEAEHLSKRCNKLTNPLCEAGKYNEG